MKTKNLESKQRRTRHPLWPNPLSTELMPYVDKPRLRRAVGSATMAGGLLLSPASVQAQSPPATFLLRSVDSTRGTPFPPYTGVDTARLVDVDGDADLDLITSYYTCGGTSTYLFENAGTPTIPRFKHYQRVRNDDAKAAASQSVQETALAVQLSADAPFDSGPVAYGDLDGDGDYDAVVFGKVDRENVCIRYYENIGDVETPQFVNHGESLPANFESGIFGGIPGDTVGAAVFADADGDGDWDAKVADTIYCNTGTARSPEFVQDADLSAEFFPEPAANAEVDIDGDGDLDLLAGQYDGTIEFSQQVGAGLKVVTGPENPFDGFRFAGLPNISVVDIDGDQDPDAFVSDGSGRVFFFENVTPPASVTDVDEDGLPDAWEVQHFGGVSSFDAHDDPDADGLTNEQELAQHASPVEADTDGDGYLDGTEVSLGTLPLVPATDPPVTEQSASPAPSVHMREIGPATVRLEVLLPVGASSQVWHSSDPENWTPLGEPFTGTGQIQEIEVQRAPNEQQGFYRIQPAP